MPKLSKQQLNEVKTQLLSQIETFPEKQKISMKKQIFEMSDDELEKFLEKNNLLNINNSEQSPFRMIVDNKIPSFKVAENKNALAVLELNPISKGHIIIIPRIPYKASEIPDDIQRFSQLMASQIKQKLNPKDVQIAISEVFNEVIINVLPIYNNETFKSERKKASENELKELQEILQLPPPPEFKPEAEIIKIDQEDSKEEQDESEEKVKKRKIPINKLPRVPKRQP